MGNENAGQGGSPESQAASGVGQTANMGRSTSVAGGAAKVFREFKWGLLTLFLLMVVVIGLVYDGGRKKKGLDAGDPSKTAATPDINIDPADTAPPPGPGGTPSTTADLSDPNAGPATPPPAGPTVTPPPTTSSPSNASRSGPPVDVPDPRTVNNNPNHRTLSPMPSTGLGEPTPLPVDEPKVAVKSSRPGEHGKTAKHGEEPKETKEVAKAPTGPEHNYVVKAGDTLTKIANKELPGKGNVKAILAANKDTLSDANRLKVGMTLKIPASLPVTPTEAVAKKTEAKTGRSASSMTAENPNEKAEKTEAAVADAYTVQSGDTLERIARKLFNDGRKWRSLYEWNREQIPDPSRLRVGQTLRVKDTAGARSASHNSSRAEADIKTTDETVTASMTTTKAEKKSKAETEEQDPTGGDVQACSSSAMMP